jgi:hypothetical protein
MSTGGFPGEVARRPSAGFESLRAFFAPIPIDPAFTGRDGTRLEVRPQPTLRRVALRFDVHAVIEGVRHVRSCPLTKRRPCFT